MRARVIISPEADADSAAILKDLAVKAGVEAANRYEAAFDSVYERLAEFPASGSPRPRLGEHVRICLVSPYLIFYDHAGEARDVMILRIAHGRRRISRKLLRSQAP
jgi:toxin ParE1/3/4